MSQLVKKRGEKVYPKSKLGSRRSVVNEESSPQYARIKKSVPVKSRRTKIESSGIYHVMESADKIWRVVPEGSQQSIKNFKYQPKAIEYVQNLKGPVVNIVIHAQGKIQKQLAPESLHIIASGSRWLVVPKGQVKAVKSFSAPGAAVQYAKKLQAPQTRVVLHNEDGEVEKVYR